VPRRWSRRRLASTSILRSRPLLISVESHGSIDNWSEEELIVLGRWLSRLVRELSLPLHNYTEAVAYEAGIGSCANQQDVITLLRLLSGVTGSTR